MRGVSTHSFIGITTWGQNENREFALFANYVKAIRQSVGLPILRPPGDMHPEAILTRIDSLVLTGDGDIEPIHYGGSVHPTMDKVDKTTWFQVL